MCICKRFDELGGGYIIPTIQKKLAENGSPRAIFETTDDRLSFVVTIPIHENCNPDFEFNATGSDTSSDTGSDTRVNNAEKILVLIGKKPNISASEIAALIGISSRAVEKQLKKLRDSGIIRHTGPKFGGQWEILKKQ